uniref:Uncharacterized protein n=1 Tax=Oryza sativa subsp. japonica TaxID=39947 RepID=Q69TT7_ORYSJ|nr:hypothetical protein [Oryza sativa Japonica Group]
MYPCWLQGRSGINLFWFVIEVVSSTARNDGAPIVNILLIVAAIKDSGTSV